MKMRINKDIGCNMFVLEIFTLLIRWVGTKKTRILSGENELGGKKKQNTLRRKNPKPRKEPKKKKNTLPSSGYD